MKIIEEVLQHPMSTTTAGVGTAVMGAANKMFEYLPVMHEIFSYSCMTIGAVGTLVGIWATAKNWRANGRLKELDIKIKERQLEKLEAKK